VSHVDPDYTVSRASRISLLGLPFGRATRRIPASSIFDSTSAALMRTFVLLDVAVVSGLRRHDETTHFHATTDGRGSRLRKRAVARSCAAVRSPRPRARRCWPDAACSDRDVAARHSRDSPSRCGAVLAGGRRGAWGCPPPLS